MTQLILAFGWALLDSLWQGSVVALLLVVAFTFLRRAEQRYWVACAALASIPFIFSWSVVGHYIPGTMNSVGRFITVGKTQTLSVFGTETSFLVGRYLEPLLPVITTLWLVGVIIHSILLTGGALRLRKLRRSVQAVSLTWQRRFRDLVQRLGVSDSVELRESSCVNVPTVIGLFKPLILVPGSVMSHLTPAQLEAVLIHELVHIRRYDPLVNALQVITETLFFYHPAVRWISIVVRQEREYCCDNAVVALTGNAVLYAKTLNELESLRTHSSKLILAASGGQFMKRIRRLVQPQQVTYQPLRFALLSLLLAGSLVACTSDSLRMGASHTALDKAETYCLQSTSVRTGSHEMAAFNDASLRAMKTELTRRGYGVDCEGASATLNLAYDMVFDAQSLSWRAQMRVSDSHGNLLHVAAADDAIDKNGAFQYTTESTAQRLLGRILDFNK